jgi:hypothetical protein
MTAERRGDGRLSPTFSVSVLRVSRSSDTYYLIRALVLGHHHWLVGFPKTETSMTRSTRILNNVHSRSIILPEQGVTAEGRATYITLPSDEMLLIQRILKTGLCRKTGRRCVILPSIRIDATSNIVQHFLNISGNTTYTQQTSKCKTWMDTTPEMNTAYSDPKVLVRS